MKSKKEVLIESVKSKSKSEEGKTRQLHHNATTTTRPRAALRSESRSATTTVGLQRLLQLQVGGQRKALGAIDGRARARRQLLPRPPSREAWVLLLRAK